MPRSGWRPSANPRWRASIEYVVTVPKQSVPLSLKFQSQAAVLGANGITHEVLLAVLIDRLQGFQGGPYACRENAIALTKLEEALLWLNKRTLQRVARGVEGTHQV